MYVVASAKKHAAGLEKKEEEKETQCLSSSTRGHCRKAY